MELTENDVKILKNHPHQKTVLLLYVVYGNGKGGFDNFRGRFKNSRKPLHERPGRAAACEACGRECLTVWDHDHATGLFRGWLCSGCNVALGFAKDSPTTLRALATYLERF